MHSDYAHLQELLSREHSLTDAAEAHGTLAGSLCGVSGYRLEDWLKEILPEGRPGQAAAGELAEVYRATATALREPGMELQLLLPDDEAAIEPRTAALAQWCQGFLYGLGAGSITDPAHLPGEVGEIVRDFVEITRAGVDRSQSEESNESAYAELVEFVRVGAQLLFEELAGARRPGAPAPAPLH